MGGQLQVAHRHLSGLSDDDLRRLLDTLTPEVMRNGWIEAARERARQQLYRFGVVAAEHITIEAFCIRLGVELISVRLDGADAQLVRNGSRAVIMVSDRVTDIGALRFGIAHELGHFLLGHPMKSASVLRAINVAFRELTFA